MIFTLPPAEIDRLRPLRLALHRHHAEFGSPPGYATRDEDDAWDTWRAATARSLESNGAAVLVHAESEDAELDGYAFLLALASEQIARPVVRPVGAHVELMTLVVAPTARSAGVGAALMTAAEEWTLARGAQTMHIVVRSDNVDALRFYHRLGAVDTFQTLLLPVG